METEITPSVLKTDDTHGLWPLVEDQRQEGGKKPQWAPVPSWRQAWKGVVGVSSSPSLPHWGQTPGLTKGGNQCEGLVSPHRVGGEGRGPGSLAPSSTTTVPALG